MECPPGMSHPSFAVNHSILEAVRPRLKDFHQLLLEPPKVPPPSGSPGPGSPRSGLGPRSDPCLFSDRKT